MKTQPGSSRGVLGGGGGCSEGGSGKCEALKEVPEASIGFHGMRGTSWSCLRISRGVSVF